MKKSVIIVLTALAVCSCSVTESYKVRTSRSVEVPVKFETQPTVADLEVSETKVSGTSEGWVNGDTRKSRIVTNARKEMESYAVANALEKSNADILVDPQYTYHFKNSVLVLVTVTGHPATYRNFRTVPYEEILKSRAADKQAQNQQIIVYGRDNE